MIDATIKTQFERVLVGVPGQIVVLTPAPFAISATNDGGRAALLVRVSLAPGRVIRDGQGFTVSTARSGSDEYVKIAASDRGLPPLFLKLAEYVVERVTATSSGEQGVEVLVNAFEEFRRFTAFRRGRLPEPLVRGTFAELVLLRALLARGMDPTEAVSAWRGPDAKAGLGVHDFTFANGRGIEVKSTRQPPGTIRVSSPSQLVPSSEPLDLLVLPLEDAPEGSRTALPFRSYALETGHLFTSASPIAADKWNAALDVLSLDLEDEWYDQYQFIPGEWRRFEVREGFPYLDVASLPAGVIDVRYSLELARLAPFSAQLGDLLQRMGLS